MVYLTPEAEANFAYQLPDNWFHDHLRHIKSSTSNIDIFYDHEPGSSQETPQRVSALALTTNTANFYLYQMTKKNNHQNNVLVTLRYVHNMKINSVYEFNIFASGPPLCLYKTNFYL